MANTYKKEINKIFVQTYYVSGELTLVDVVTRIDYMIVGTSSKTDASAHEVQLPSTLINREVQTGTYCLMTLLIKMSWIGFPPLLKKRRIGITEK